MTAHLSEEEIVASLMGSAAGPNPAATEEHLAQCVACARERDTLRAALDALPEHAAQIAERPAEFWRAQRLAIAVRIEKFAPGEMHWLTWGTAVAASLVLATMLIQSPAPTRPVAKVDPDHELLVSVERSLRRSVPVALEPVTLITEELHSAAKKKSSP